MCDKYDVAREVIRGKWGNGKERKIRLIKEGYDYGEIQNIVNKLLGYKKRHPHDYEDNDNKDLKLLVSLFWLVGEVDNI